MMQKKSNRLFGLTILAFALLCMSTAKAATGLDRLEYHQDRLTVKGKNIKSIQVLVKISEVAGVTVFLVDGIDKKVVDLDFTDESVEIVLRYILRGSNYALIFVPSGVEPDLIQSEHSHSLENGKKSMNMAYGSPGRVPGSLSLDTKRHSNAPTSRKRPTLSAATPITAPSSGGIWIEPDMQPPVNTSKTKTSKKVASGAQKHQASTNMGSVTNTEMVKKTKYTDPVEEEAPTIEYTPKELLEREIAWYEERINSGISDTRYAHFLALENSKPNPLPVSVKHEREHLKYLKQKLAAMY